MKHIISTVFYVFFSINSFGQNIFPTTGKVGIKTMKPLSDFSIENKIHLGYNALFNNNDWDCSNQFTFKQNGILEVKRIHIKEKVGILTYNPDEALAAKGKIHTEEVKVDLAFSADYVFQKYYTGSSELNSDYELLSLREVEEFIYKNHHLPATPSAIEIQENGFELGNINTLLLQKKEELTLYLLEQRKEFKSIKTELQTLKSLIHE